MRTKIIFSILILGWSSMAFAAAQSLVAADGTKEGIGTKLGGYTPTKNVRSVYESSDTGGGTSYNVYSIATKHKQGDKIYGSTSVLTTYGQKDAKVGDDVGTGDLATVPDTTTNSALAGFTVM